MSLRKLIQKTRIYADAAAGTPISKNATKELVQLLGVYGNAGALHKEALEAKAAMDEAREKIAKAIGAHSDEIIFTASGTESNNLAIQGILRPLLQERGELHAITCAIEHQSVLEPLRALEVEGLYVTELPVDSQGFVSLEQLKEAINEQTVFISIQLVNSEVGTIEPVHEIAKAIRQAKRSRANQLHPTPALGRSGPLGQVQPSLQGGVALPVLPLYFHTDAAQAPLWMPLRVDQLGVDLMTLDAQKVLGPKGVGCLYVRRGSDIEPVLRGGVQEFNLRAGTPNTPLAGSFGVAMAEAASGVEARAEKTAAMRDFLYTEIKKRIPDVLVNGPVLDLHLREAKLHAREEKQNEKRELKKRVANNLNISIPGLDAEMAVIALDVEGVAVSTRSACNIGSDEPSHVIKALGVSGAMSKTAIRITLLPDLTKKDALYIAEALVKVVKRYRSEVY
ncbi:MAG: cysteine desulfurase family protein [bacterium]